MLRVSRASAHLLGSKPWLASSLACSFATAPQRSSEVLDLNVVRLNASNRKVAAPHKPPLIVLHGLFGNVRNWRTVSLRLLEEGVVGEVIAMDLRNHGTSPRSADCSVQSMTLDVVHTMRSHGIPPSSTLLGHSMGGKVTMNLCLQHPDMISKAVVVDIAPMKHDTRSEFMPMINALRNLNLTPENPENSIKKISRGQLDAALAKDIPNPGVRTFLLSNVATENGQWKWLMNLDAIEVWLDDIGHMPKEMASLSSLKDVRFIMGAKSSYSDPSHHDVIYKHFPTAQIEVIPNSGHWLHAEQPDLFIENVKNFLA